MGGHLWPAARGSLIRSHGSSDSDSDEEDDTAALMAELNKIKRERAEEKARQVGLGPALGMVTPHGSDAPRPS